MPLDLQVERVPDEVLATLDGAAENYELTAGAHMACCLYGDRAELQRIYDVRHGKLVGWQERAAKATNYEVYGRSLMAEVEPEMGAALRGASTLTFIRILADRAEYLGTDSFVDAIWGGNSLPFKRPSLITDRGKIPRRIERRLMSRSFVQRRVRADRDEIGRVHLQHIWDGMGNRLDPPSESCFELINRMWTEQRERTRVREAEWMRDIGRQRYDDDLIVSDALQVLRLKKVKPHARRDMVRKKQRVAKKAANVAATLLGPQTVSAFARGEPISIPAGEITLELTAGKSILSAGHSGIDVALHSPDGTFLSKLCVYQELPVLDQLASMALYAQAGEIKDVLAAGNLYNTAEGAFENPLLAEKRAARLANNPEMASRIEEVEERPRGRRELKREAVDSWEYQRRRTAEYLEKMRPLYEERLFADVIGQRLGGAAYKFHESLGPRLAAIHRQAA